MIRYFLIFSLLLPSGFAQEAEVAILRETIAQIEQVRTQIALEMSAQEAKTDQVQALLELHRKELAALEEELAASGQSAPEFEEKRSEAEEEIAKLKELRGQTAEVLAMARPRLLALLPAFPEPLLNELEQELANLRDWRETTEPRPALQAYLDIITAAERFNRGIRQATQIQEGREVEVLYLGLARAFALGPDGTALLGLPSREGWSWEVRPELSGPLESAFAQLAKKRPPGLIELPLAVKPLTPQEK